jgi:hypothetical protein
MALAAVTTTFLKFVSNRLTHVSTGWTVAELLVDAQAASIRGSNRVDATNMYFSMEVSGFLCRVIIVTLHAAKCKLLKFSEFFMTEWIWPGIFRKFKNRPSRNLARAKADALA